MSGWSQERIDLLKKLWAEGHSCSRIAARLGGITRNAVIGKVTRLGLQPRNTQGRKSPVHSRRECRVITRKARATTAASGRSRFGSIRANSGPPCDPLPLPKQDVPSGPLVAFADLEPHHCRFPYGDPKHPGFGFCGCQKVPAIPYCEAHARVCYATVNVKNREQVKEAA